MAVGDVVNAIGVANTIIYFQPALGVTCLISCVIRAEQVCKAGFSDGTSLSYDNVPANSVGMQNIKQFINNTNYLFINACGAGKMASYSGIQIQ
tara:strand:- start:158 stop:439 length:282 start_codon:yes stop_codon:yes gene_type:complete